MMLLLDTCIVYDWLMDEMTDQRAIELVANQGASVSPVTVWEMAIKHSLGKMELPSSQLAADIEAQGFRWVNITAHHAQTVLELASHHKDPFDRLLIAQAKCEAMCILTYDTIFQRYLRDAIIVHK